MRPNTGGFTLIELLVTLSVAAILLTIAAPNFQTFILNNRIANQSNMMLAALNYARSEAVRRGSTVTACPSSTGNSCSGSTSWSTGWIVFVDPNADGVVAASGDVLRVFPALSGNNTLTAGTNTYFPFGGSGALAAGTAGDDFRLCDSRGVAYSRDINVLASGRVATTGAASTCP